jgi:predicted dehydrogenase
MSSIVRVGIVGAGGFARFVAAQLVELAQVQVVAAFDTDPAAIEALRAIVPALKVCPTLQALLADADVDLVYIASPPALHHAHSLAALQAGKHVVCEKPAALSMQQASELQGLAERLDKLFVVNLMQRYNPLYRVVGQLLQDGWMGEFLHGFFENYASDEALLPGHWFWDAAQSGGIFIEHGVHFFDMFAGWLGTGQVVAAQTFERPGHAGVRDIAQCTAVYRGCAPVHFFHGFNQPKVLDRQEMRLQFERGDVTLHEWVPNQLVLRAVCTDDELAALTTLLPDATVQTIERFDSVQVAAGRFKPVRFQQRVRIDTGPVQTKTALYQRLVRDMFVDQLAWLQDRGHRRVIDAGNAVASVAVAEQAQCLASGSA